MKFSSTSCAVSLGLLLLWQPPLRQVLLYDPLYMWTISPVRALHIQRQPEGEDTNASTASEGIFEEKGVYTGLSVGGKCTSMIWSLTRSKALSLSLSLSLSLTHSTQVLLEEALSLPMVPAARPTRWQRELCYGCRRSWRGSRTASR